MQLRWHKYTKINADALSNHPFRPGFGAMLICSCPARGTDGFAKPFDANGFISKWMEVHPPVLPVDDDSDTIPAVLAGIADRRQSPRGLTVLRKIENLTKHRKDAIVFTDASELGFIEFVRLVNMTEKHYESNA